MSKQFLFESTFLVIMDPTSVTVKNVTPYCTQIYEVLEYFKRVYFALNAIREECLMSLGLDRASEAGQTDAVSAEAMQHELDRRSTQVAHSPARLLGKLMNLIDITQCDQTLEE